jgi:hypothetical protein
VTQSFSLVLFINQLLVYPVKLKSRHGSIRQQKSMELNMVSMLPDLLQVEVEEEEAEWRQMLLLDFLLALALLEEEEEALLQMLFLHLFKRNSTF